MSGLSFSFEHAVLVPCRKSVPFGTFWESSLRSISPFLPSLKIILSCESAAATQNSTSTEDGRVLRQNYSVPIFEYLEGLRANPVNLLILLSDSDYADGKRDAQLSP